MHRKRGRKPGSKAQPHWLRPGPKPKTKTQGKHANATTSEQNEKGKKKKKFNDRNTDARDRKNNMRAKLKSIYTMNKIIEMKEKF